MAADRIKVRAPSTMANLGPGFDVFGIALAEPYDTIEVRKTSEKGVRVEKIEGIGAHAVTIDNSRNTAAVAASKVLELAKADFGLTMSIRKGIRPASGMGSSGASAAGGAYAAAMMLDKMPSIPELVYCGMKGEEASSGSGHADNVAPALVGGFTIIRSYDPVEVVRLDPPKDLGLIAVLPSFAVPTKEARKVVPKTVDLKTMIFQMGHAASFVAGMAKGDIDLIASSVKDAIVEPARAPLIPHLKEAEKVALKAGAMASFLAGSGPTIGSFYDTRRTDGIEIANAVQSFYENRGIEVLCYVTTWGEGCRVEQE